MYLADKPGKAPANRIPEARSGDSSGGLPPRRRKGTRGIGRRAWLAAAVLIACIFAVLACDFAVTPGPDATPQKAIEEKAAGEKAPDRTPQTAVGGTGTGTGTGERAPDFVLKDLRGERFRLSDYRGKKHVLIIFSTTWCPTCRDEIPRFKKIHETYSGRELEIVNIDIQEPQAKVSGFADKNNLPYRVLLDEDGTVSNVYDIRGVPSLVLVDQNGMIACRQCRRVETILDTLIRR